MYDKDFTTQAIQAIQTSSSTAQPPEVQNMVALFSRMKESQSSQLQKVVLGLVQMLQAIGVTDTTDKIRLMASSSHQQIMDDISVSNDVFPNAWADKFKFNAHVLAVSQSSDTQSILKAGIMQEGKAQFSDPKWATFVVEQIAESNKRVLDSSLGIG